MFVLPLWSFHIGFFGGVPWSWAAEATTLSAYFVWVATWDLLWFLLNPRYGWARFRKGEIWWHARTWIGRFPIDYWGGLVMSLVVAATARLATGDFGVLGAPRRAGGRLRGADAAHERRGARATCAGTRTCAAPAATSAPSCCRPTNGNGANGSGDGALARAATSIRAASTDGIAPQPVIQLAPLTKRKGGQSLKDHEANPGSRST